MNQSKHIIKGIIGGAKGLISQIPCIGAPLVGAWEGYWHSRSEDLIKQLCSAIDKLDKEKIDLNYVPSEEFVDLFRKASKIRIESRSVQKAKFILGMLIESMQKDRDTRFSCDLKETFLFILDQLTENEMHFLYEFSQNKYSQKSKNDIYGMGDNYAIAIDGLLSKGILRERETWNKHISESMLGQVLIKLRYESYLMS